MIGKCKSSGVNLSFYLLKGEGNNPRKNEEVKLIYKHNLISSEPAGINAEMKMQASTSLSRKKVNKYIQHIIFSHHKSDNVYAKKNEKELINETLNKLNSKGLTLDETQFYIVRHEDKEHLHYHIAFNKVDNSGLSIKMHNASINCKKIAVEISQKHELKCGVMTSKSEAKNLEDEQKEIIRRGKKNDKINRPNEQIRVRKNKGISR